MATTPNEVMGNGHLTRRIPNLGGPPQTPTMVEIKSLAWVDAFSLILHQGSGSKTLGDGKVKESEDDGGS